MVEAEAQTGSTAEPLDPPEPGRQSPQLPAAQTSHLPQRVHKHKGRKLTLSDYALMVKLSKEGHTQTAIAQRFNCDQSLVSKWLSQLEDSTELATSFLRGSALRMAQNVVKKGRPSDHIAVLKGVNVLADDSQKQGVTVLVGSGGQVNIGLLSPPAVQVQSESVQNPQQIALGSDKQDYVNEVKSLITKD